MGSKNLSFLGGSRRRRIAQSRDNLYRVALAWCGDEMLADDLVQETIEAGIQKRQQLRDENRLVPWLYSILNNRWRQHLRSVKEHDGLDEQMASNVAGPCASVEELETVRQVRNAVSLLNEKERQVISLVDLGELSYCEVASILGIPVGTVMSRLHRARKNLLARLEAAAPLTGATRPAIRVVK